MSDHIVDCIKYPVSSESVNSWYAGVSSRIGHMIDGSQKRFDKKHFCADQRPQRGAAAAGVRIPAFHT
ncbi:hypothetical protein ACFFJ7_14355 [Pseudochelatococcus lubricantis]|uniref:hypothetical protein n=1 Tax=Pseudochelatococcus lubricantis TaxID=1538102 RepID=UPI0035EF7065